MNITANSFLGCIFSYSLYTGRSAEDVYVFSILVWVSLEFVITNEMIEKKDLVINTHKEKNTKPSSYEKTKEGGQALNSLPRAAITVPSLIDFRKSLDTCGS